MDLQPGKKRECVKCSKPFKSNTDLTRHMVTHDPVSPVKCEVCRKIYKNRPSLSFHMRTVHSNRERPRCDTCHRVFATLSKLQRHNTAVHSTIERPRFPCTYPGCEKTYLTKHHIAQHVDKEHAENPVRFPCTLCGKAHFKTRTHLEGHILTHTTEKPYNCTFCGRSFADKGNMTNHEKTHLEKSTRLGFQCQLCPQTVLNRPDLKRHVRFVHENQRNYPCTNCEKTFADRRGLTRHVEARHAANQELKIHSCDKCEYKSHSKGNLDAHKIRHNGVRHGCYFCRKKFVIFSQLVRHCRVHTLEKLKT